MTVLERRVMAFFFPVADARWLSFLRIGVGLQILLYATSIRREWVDLFSSAASGLLDRRVAEAILSIDSSLTPRIGWLVSFGKELGISESAALDGLYWLLLASGLCLVTGCFSREAAFVAWLIHLAAVKSGDMLSYGMDNFTTIALFYLLLSPLPDALSVDYRFRKVRPKAPTWHGFARRVLQLHLSFIYLFAGLAKALGPGWWNGESLWRALTRTPFNVIPTDTLVSLGWLLPASGILTCFLELAYPLFIWPKSTRPFWLAAIVAMHFVIALTMGLYLFGLIMITLNLAGFLPNLRQRGAGVLEPARANDWTRPRVSVSAP